MKVTVLGADEQVARQSSKSVSDDMSMVNSLRAEEQFQLEFNSSKTEKRSLGKIFTSPSFMKHETFESFYNMMPLI